MDVGKNIELYRKDKGLTQQQLSELSGIPAISIGRYERGERNPDIKTIEKIANTLDIDLYELLNEKRLTLGKKIKLHRIKRNITHQQLADAIGKSKSLIEKYEADKIENPSFTVLKSIAEVLQISFDALFNDIESVECLDDETLIKELLKRGYRVFKEYKEGEF